MLPFPFQLSHMLHSTCWWQCSCLVKWQNLIFSVNNAFLILFEIHVMVLTEEKCLLLLLLLLQRSVITYITLSQGKITLRTTIKNKKNFQLSDNIILCIITVWTDYQIKIPFKEAFFTQACIAGMALGFMTAFRA